MKITEITLPNNARAIKAHYKVQVINEYKNNILIEALPEIKSIDNVIEILGNYPTFKEAERNLDSHIRVHLVQNIFQYFQPVSLHLDLESRISRMIRQGYIARNPLEKEFVVESNVISEYYINKNHDIESDFRFRSTAFGFAIVGISGVGKTTGINKILGTYPKVIVHNEYRGNKLSLYQVVWLKLDCSHDGSLKGLCLEFFRKVDEQIGTDYFKKYGNGRLAVNNLLPIMAQVARSLSLGLLVIDEIQHLSYSKNYGHEQTLNFFVTLINTISIPVILIGTPKALGLLTSQFRQARRSTGSQGDMIWDKMKNDETWLLLLEGLFKYQWNRKPIKLNRDISDLLYDKSQGIMDIAIKIFASAQVNAILSGKEMIDFKLIEKVSRENFKLIEPMIDALRKNDIKELSRFEDIYLPGSEINSNTLRVENQMINIVHDTNTDKIQENNQNATEINIEVSKRKYGNYEEEKSSDSFYEEMKKQNRIKPIV